MARRSRLSPMNWPEDLYEVFGVNHPIASLIAITLLGAILFGGGWWIIGQKYKKHHPPASKTVPGSGPDRHLTTAQVDRALVALRPYTPGLIGIATLKKDERMAYAREIADVFGRAGWSAVPYCVDNFREDREGILVVRHSQGNLADSSPVRAALEAMRIPHYEVSTDVMQYPIFGVPCDLLGGPGGGINTLNSSGVNTSTPVIFVGSKP
jgi:hypothetical protein